jgi:hypothetical protein
VHHFGLEDAVDHRIRNSIRVRYKARRLLGFGPGDRDTMTAEIMAWLSGGNSPHADIAVRPDIQLDWPRHRGTAWFP